MSSTASRRQRAGAARHRYFAIADEFLDTRLDEHGATHVARRKRDEAAVHI
ncbi:MAG: hypothetical protein HY744_17020, partial [Deltaproteobacteria bacterium]|nr:hypothetical protein [Deltaproteobacteria bacterium]